MVSRSARNPCVGLLVVVQLVHLVALSVAPGGANPRKSSVVALATETIVMRVILSLIKVCRMAEA